MNRFRKLALEKIAASVGFLSNIGTPSQSVKRTVKEGGILMDKVKEHFGDKKEPTGCAEFKKKFLSMQPGLERENFIYEEVTKRKILKLVDMKVVEPDGTEITYKVMPDYVTICGIRLPMAGQTAQKIADHFNMHIPDPEQSKQIWEAADIKVRPPPLSGTGYKDPEGRYWSQKEVVQGRISKSDAADEYSRRIREEISKAVRNYEGKPQSVAGHMKDIVVMPGKGKAKRLGLYGWFDPETGDPLEPSKQTGHDTSVHSEYGAGLRLMADRVKVKRPGEPEKTMTMDEYRGPVQRYV